MYLSLAKWDNLRKFNLSNHYDIEEITILELKDVAIWLWLTGIAFKLLNLVTFMRISF